MTMVLRPDQSADDLIAAGAGGCPRCGGPLRRWGSARWRDVRGLAGAAGFRPPRVRCRDCGTTQVVLPADVLLRRRDAAVVVGRAWRRAAGGAGARRVARAVGVPVETVRGWLRRLRALAQDRHRAKVPAGGLLRLELARWEARASAAGCTGELALWRFAAHATQGRLLSNTS
jgi:hypothetical protein